MKILVTGGFGFIGSNFINYISKNFPHITIYNIDKLSPQSKKKNIKSKRIKNYVFDLTNLKKLENLFSKNNFHYIYHFAAESHVDRSINNPKLFINSNIIGTFNLLEVAKKFKPKKFINISTDEIYGSTEKKKFTENSPMLPSSPYSSSKAAASNLVNAWGKTYKLSYLNLYLCNNYGPLQNTEKLIPKIINSLRNNLKVPIYGSGNNIREWMYVEDSCKIIYSLSKKNNDIQNLNISSNINLNNLMILKKIFQIMKKNKMIDKKKLLKDTYFFVKDRPGHDFAYLLSTKKMKSIMKFKFTSFEDGILKTLTDSFE